jgi:hypothetical protein
VHEGIVTYFRILTSTNKTSEFRKLRSPDWAGLPPEVSERHALAARTARRFA